MYKKCKKIVASMIVFMMMIANLSTVGIHIGEVIAIDTDLANQNSKTNNSNILFDTYFENSSEKYNAKLDVDSENRIIAKITVKDEGYLKDAMITFNDANFNLKAIENTNKVLEQKQNTITLNQINSGENEELVIPIELGEANSINASKLNKINAVKFTGTYIDGKGKSKNIEKEILLGLKWEEKNITTVANVEVMNFIPFVNGVKVQLNVETHLAENVLPMQEVTSIVDIPNINGIYPTKVTVNNVEDYTQISKDNYNYNNGKVTINIKNDPLENGEIKKIEHFGKYIINCTYSQEAYNSLMEKGNTVIESTVSTNIKQYNSDLEYKNDGNIQKEFTSEHKDLVANFAISVTEQLSKGYMYANQNTTQKIETIYKQELSTIIVEPSVIETLEINSLSENLVDEKNNTYSVDTYYKNVKVNKNLFNTIFGEEGYIDIYSGETLKVRINKDILKDIDTIIEINAEKINIKTSSPNKEGKLTLVFEKAISKDFSGSQIGKSVKLVSNTEAKAIEKNIIKRNIQEPIVASTNLVEPTAEVILQMDNNNLSTIVENENVELRAVLKTDSEYNKLFANPIIKIDLPEYIENIQLKNVEVLYDNELTKVSERIIEKSDGTKQIEVILNGTQTKYNIGSVYGGTNILIVADIKVNNLTPNKEDILTLTCTSGEDVITATKTINFVAPVGVVAVNKISNYAEGQSDILTITSDKEAKLQVTEDERIAKVEMQVINNYNNKINDIKILGRTLATGATKIESTESLNNTFDAPMLNAINTNDMANAIVYYSENGAATADLQNVENAWTTDITDFSRVKSYLIVLTDYQMARGDVINFSYDVKIPENLEYSQSISTLYTVYFNNITRAQTLQDKVNSSVITLTTGVAPTLEVNLTSTSLENSIVREGQYVKFIANIKNIGTIDAENAVLKVSAPNGNIYTYKDAEGNVKFTEDVSLIENLETQLVATYSSKHIQYLEEDFSHGYEDVEGLERIINIGTIKAGETVKVEYEIELGRVEIFKKNCNYNKVDDKIEFILPEVFLNNSVRVMADEMQKEVYSNVYKLKMDEGYLQIFMKADKTYDYTLIKGDEINYKARVISIYNHGNLNNVVITMQLPAGLIIEEAELENSVTTDQEIIYTTKIDNDKNQAIFTIEELPVGWEVVCKAKAIVGDVQGNIKASAKAVTENKEEHYSNITTNKVSKLTFTIKQQELGNQYVKEKQQITYTYEIENTSDVYTNSFVFENLIPEGMKFVSATIIREDTEQLIKDKIEDGKFVFNIDSFTENTKIKIQITMEASLLPTGITEKEFMNYATISGNYFETLKSNEVKTIIEYNSEEHKKPQDTDNLENPDYDPEQGEDKEGRYIISGSAWVDKNENGQRDSEEELLSGVEVRLLDKVTNEIVKDIDSGVDKITKTSSTGEYRFTNLKVGEYLVVFIYNNYKYELTAYQKSDVVDSLNSDVINMNMQIEGNEQTVAISDTLRIINSNIRNIDIGLCDSHKSSMKLDKYISSVTVTYGNTVKTYDYENSSLVKVEIPAKELSNATVIVDYKIRVTNTGSVANFVKKIVDYIPKDMKFNSELNRDWYQSSNGDLYNSSLANTKLESGQSAEVTLTLTKKMTDSNTGIVNNNAEIYELYNEEGIKDLGSTAGNKNNGENDMSAADLVISVKTGDAIAYTTLIATMICITIGISAYYIRKKVLRRM